MKNYLASLIVLVFVGCQSAGGFRIKAPETGGSVSGMAESDPLAMLSWISGLSILGGIALLVVTSGRRGKFAIGAGVGLILLNLLIARFDNYLFIPVLICTGAISAVWTYKLIRQTLTEKKNK